MRPPLADLTAKAKTGVLLRPATLLLPLDFIKKEKKLSIGPPSVDHISLSGRERTIFTG